MICKSRKSKGIIRDNVTEKRFLGKNNRFFCNRLVDKT